MSKYSTQFQPGIILQEFISQYGSEEQCYQAIYRWRWPNGFKYPECGHDRYCTLKTRKRMQCNKCRWQISITAKTIFDSTKLPLTTLIEHFMSHSKPLAKNTLGGTSLNFVIVSIADLICDS